MMKTWSLLYVAFVLLILFSLAGHVASSIWWVDILVHFRAYYVFAFLVFATLFLLKKKYLPALLSILLFVFLGWNVLQLYVPDTEIATDADVRIVSANILSSNDDHELLSGYLKDVDPDIILLLEVTDNMQPLMDSLSLDYPFFIIRKRSDNFGIALFSKTNFLQAEVVTLGNTSLPTMVVRYPGFTIIGMHALPPISAVYFDSRNLQFKQLAEIIANTKDRVIVAGDLNSSPFSVHFQQLLETAGLRYAGRGFGINATWHAGIPFVHVPLDHFLVSHEIQTAAYSTGPYVGSDHLPINAAFKLK
jgi:endonuclease/exonuclease/phosphatase (EEP) superfamily protein YafD